MKRKDAIRFVLIRSLGNFLLIFSLYGVFATFGPALQQEAKYVIIQARGMKFRVIGSNETPKKQSFADIKRVDDASSESPSFADVLSGPKEQILVPANTQFSIMIPKIGASAKIYPNVDPNKESEFLPVLQKGIAHARGSVFPGYAGNVYLFAHSTDNWWNVGRYNAVFYLLKNLSIGDQIVVFFESRRYDYAVSQTFIADPKDVSLLTAKHGGAQQLVLQTCWPPGTTWKRQIVIATPK